MLDEFYEYVRSHSEYTWLHWNMRNIHYGFQAIAHRYKVLGGLPVEIHEGNLVDLSRLLSNIYGRHYIGHPHLQKLVEKNEITDQDFLPGADEAIAFENREYVKLYFSTLRKAHILANIVQRADDGSLETDSTWKDSYGIYPQVVGEWLNEHWFVRIVEALFATVGFVWTVVEVYNFLSK